MRLQQRDTRNAIGVTSWHAAAVLLIHGPSAAPKGPQSTPKQGIV